MVKRDTSIDSNGKPGSLFGHVLSALRGVMFVDSRYAGYYRAFGLAMGFLVVGTGLIWWGDRSSYLGLMVAGISLFLLAETIWLGIGAVLLWKLVRTVIGRFWVGRRDAPGKDRNRTPSDL